MLLLFSHVWYHTTQQHNHTDCVVPPHVHPSRPPTPPNTKTHLLTTNNPPPHTYKHTFVTCPTTNTGHPTSLANLNNAALHSLTCCTLPALPFTSLRYTVCMESTTRAWGRIVAACWRIWCMLVALRSSRSDGGVVDRRVALCATCSTDSSADTYSTGPLDTVWCV